MTTRLKPHWPAREPHEGVVVAEGDWWRLRQCTGCSRSPWQLWVQERGSWRLFAVGETEAAVRAVLRTLQTARSAVRR